MSEEEGEQEEKTKQGKGLGRKAEMAQGTTWHTQRGGGQRGASSLPPDFFFFGILQVLLTCFCLFYLALS